MLRYYHYRRLSKSAQQAYKKIAIAIRKFSSCAVFEQAGNLRTILNAVENDNPHFFYVDWREIFYCNGFEGSMMIVYLKYLMPRTEAKRHLREARQIAANFAPYEGQELIRRVHDFLARNTKYNHKSVRQKEYRVQDHNMIGPLFERLGVCEGIARAAQFLLRERGVECTCCCGYVHDRDAGVEGNHAWNLVKVEGHIRKMDITWDLAGANRRISYKYFCVPNR